MQARVSSNGEVTLSEAVVRSLGAAAGDSVDIAVEGSRIVVRPMLTQVGESRIIKDPKTGFPALYIEGAPVLTSQEVAEMLVDFP